MKSGRNEVMAAFHLAKLGDVKGATRLLLELRKRPDLEAEAYYGLGLVELNLSNVRNASAYFQKAVRTDASHSDSYYQLGKLAEAGADTVMARLYYKSALACKPAQVMARAALVDDDVVVEVDFRARRAKSARRPEKPALPEQIELPIR